MSRVGSPKNGKAKTAPIYGDMGAWLEMVVSRGNIEAPRTKQLFLWADGTPIRDFRGSWETLCADVDIPELLFHNLRRTDVRNMIRAGVSEKVAMEVSGHKTSAMLWRYNIIDTRDIVEAGRRTGGYLEDQKKHLTAAAAKELLQ